MNPHREDIRVESAADAACILEDRPDADPRTCHTEVNDQQRGVKQHNLGQPRVCVFVQLAEDDDPHHKHYERKNDKELQEDTQPMDFLSSLKCWHDKTPEINQVLLELSDVSK